MNQQEQSCSVVPQSGAEEPRHSSTESVGELTLVGLMLRLAQVLYQHRERSRARLPITETALFERDLVVELHRRGVVATPP